MGFIEGRQWWLRYRQLMEVLRANKNRDNRNKLYELLKEWWGEERAREAWNTTHKLLESLKYRMLVAVMTKGFFGGAVMLRALMNADRWGDKEEWLWVGVGLVGILGMMKSLQEIFIMERGGVICETESLGLQSVGVPPWLASVGVRGAYGAGALATIMGMAAVDRQMGIFWLGAQGLSWLGEGVIDWWLERRVRRKLQKRTDNNYS